MYFLKHTDQILADRSVHVQAAEVPFLVTSVVHDGVKEDIQVVDASIPVDHPLDRGRRLVRDDQIDPAALLLQIHHGVFQLLIRRKRRGRLCFIRFGRQTASERKDRLALDGIKLAAVQTIDIVGYLPCGSLVIRHFFKLFQTLKVFVRSFDEQDVKFLFAELFQIF